MLGLLNPYPVDMRHGGIFRFFSDQKRKIPGRQVQLIRTFLDIDRLSDQACPQGIEMLVDDMVEFLYRTRLRQPLRLFVCMGQVALADLIQYRTYVSLDCILQT